MKYNQQLDGLRFVAIALVLIDHFAALWSGKLLAGYYGVDLFFVISGFLITSLLLRSNGSLGRCYTNFIGRRTLRIFPIYYLSIAILYFLPFNGVKSELVYCLTYTYNYALIYHQASLSKIVHLWSLCVEEQFYLLWPFVVLGLRNKQKLLEIIVFLLILSCIAQQILSLVPGPVLMNLRGTFPRMGALCIGAYGAILNRGGRLPQGLLKSKRIEGVAFGSLLVYPFLPMPVISVLFPLFSLYLVLKTFHGGFSMRHIDRFLKNRRIVYLGTISYGIYLYHLPLGFYLNENIIPWEPFRLSSFSVLIKLRYNFWIVEALKLPVYSLLTVGLAHLSYKYIEQPILKQKDRWFAYDQNDPVRRKKDTLVVVTVKERV